MERKRVAVFLANIYKDMTKETQYGIIEAAKKEGIKLLFFTSFNDNYTSKKYIRYKNYDKGDMSVFMLPNLAEYDGLISLDSYLPDLYKNPVNDIKRTAECPVVTLGDTPDFSYNIVNDQDKSFMEIVEHMVTCHGCKDFVLVSSDRNKSFLRDRERIFKLVMDKYGIPFSDDKIVNGNLKSICGEDVVSQIIELYKDSERKLPEAIVCVNDYTVLGVLNALQTRGYSVPDDVLITGYDDMLQSKYSEPSITTSRQPFENVGRAGVETLVKLWNNEDVPKTQALPGIIKIRESCGCKSCDKIRINEIRDAYDLIIEKQDDLSLSATNLVLGIQEAETIKGVFDEIEANCLNETGFKDAVLCLADNWKEKRIINSSKDLMDTQFSVVCGKYKGQSVDRRPIPKGSLLPDYMMNDPEPYYIFPIHNIQYFLGYFIVSPTLNDLGQINIKSWLSSVGVQLMSWNTSDELKNVVEKMRDLSNRDMLTGLYNRRGYDTFFGKYYNDCIETEKSLTVFAMDMDDMKIVNDTYGHLEGDYCLCTIADSLRKVSENEEICIRAGGDEFVIIGKDFTKETAEEYISHIRDEIDRKCTADGKSYKIKLSVGYEIKSVDELKECSVYVLKEGFIKHADERMYEEKRLHHMA